MKSAETFKFQCILYGQALRQPDIVFKDMPLTCKSKRLLFKIAMTVNINETLGVGIYPLESYSSSVACIPLFH
jgi:hypothetical protein